MHGSVSALRGGRRRIALAAGVVLALGCGGKLADITEPPDVDASESRDARAGDEDADATAADQDGASAFDAEPRDAKGTDATRDAAPDASSADADVDSALDAGRADATVNACPPQGCAASVVVSTTNPITCLAADDTAAYWHDGELHASSLLDGGTTTTLVTGVACDRALIGNATDLYWVAGGQVAAVSKTVPSGVTYVSGASGVRDIALDVNGLWYVRASPVPTYGTEFWHVTNLPAGPGAPTVFFDDVITRISANDRFTIAYISPEHYVITVSGGDTIGEAVAFTTEFAALAADADYAYWISPSGTLRRAEFLANGSAKAAEVL